MVSFRATPKLSNYLVKTRLYPLERTVRSRKCTNKRCEVCENVQNSDTFRRSVTSKTIKIYHLVVKFLVYLFSCKSCSKQYTGETTDYSRHRWNSYISNDKKFKRKEHCRQEHLHEHFDGDSHNGFLEDVAIPLTAKILKTDGKDPKNRDND